MDSPYVLKLKEWMDTWRINPRLCCGAKKRLIGAITGLSTKRYQVYTVFYNRRVCMQPVYL
ncbi:MAG: hypothetical protein VR64_08090 [Desulfatitalea sp. BRH_c12]|nr:MAG: hypothetical protein VR64_08090 [Desulfatitalea sp. BRH_c12]